MTPTPGSVTQLTTLLATDRLLRLDSVRSADAVQAGAVALSRAPVSYDGDGSTTSTKIERVWQGTNPAGRVEKLARDEVVLWNFAIGRAELKPEHLAALQDAMGMKQLSPSVSATILGFASMSGEASGNTRLAHARARAVSDWLTQFQNTDALDQTEDDQSPARTASPALVGGSVQSATDGESMARSRAVLVSLVAATSDGGSVPPSPVLVPLPDGGPPVVATCSGRSELTVRITKAPLGTIPRNGWLDGTVFVDGTAKVTLADGKPCSSLALALDPGDQSVASKFTAQLSDYLAVKLDEQFGPKGAKAGLSAAVGWGKPWSFEIGVKAGSQNWLTVTSPKFSTTLGAGEPGAFSWGPQKVTVALELTLVFEGRPGEKTLEMLSDWAAGLEMSAAELAGFAGGIVASVALFYFIIEAAADADANALQRAATMAAQDGYLAELAAALSDEGTEEQVAGYLNPWSDPQLPHMGTQAEAGRRLALRQLGALGSQLEPRIGELRRKYAVGSDGVAQPFHAVLAGLRQRLGEFEWLHTPSLADF
jgi:hypothetical protein